MKKFKITYSFDIWGNDRETVTVEALTFYDAKRRVQEERGFEPKFIVKWEVD